MYLEFSRRLALVFGVATPLLETARRWHQLSDWRMAPFWLDDYLLGGLLLYGAWRVSQNALTGRSYLAAAWGFTCGMAYASFFHQLTQLHSPDPAPIAPEWVAAIKGVGLFLAILALIGSLRRLPAAAIN